LFWSHGFCLGNGSISYDMSENVNYSRYTFLSAVVLHVVDVAFHKRREEGLNSESLDSSRNYQLLTIIIILEAQS
jgi:hypothetical protein